jgi:hypothetical protein
MTTLWDAGGKADSSAGVRSTFATPPIDGASGLAKGLGPLPKSAQADCVPL